MINFNKLTDPQEFISFYFNQLQTELESNELTISKVGALGYLLHIMGNMQFDIKQYYDGLFREAFPISALDDSNLQQHSLTFGYNYDNAKSALLDGFIEFDFLNLPARSNIVTKREIVLRDINFILDDLNFILLSSYKVIIDISLSSEQYQCQIIDENFDFHIHPISNTNPTVPLLSCKQYSEEVRFFNIPSYPFASYYSIEIDIVDQIETIKIDVKEYNSEDYKSFNVSKTKTFFRDSDEYVFYKIQYRQNIPLLIIELGSGIKGKYIPNSEIKVTIYTTKGAMGNIGNTVISREIKGYLEIIDYKDSEVVYTISNIFAANQFLKINIENGSGGRDILSGNSLRKELLTYIQTRNNLISELDFNNILSKYFKYFCFLFKKTHFQDNIMSIYISFLNRYLQPVKTISKNINENDFENKSVTINDIKYVIFPEFTFNDTTFVSPLLYQYNNLLNVYSANLLIKSSIFSISNIIKLNDSYTGIEPLIKLKVEFDIEKLNIKFAILPLIADSSFKYKIITDIIQGFVDETTKELLIDKLIYGSFIVNVDIFKNDDRLFQVKFNNIGLIENISDILKLKKFSGKIIDVPLIEKGEFFNDEVFYLNKLSNQLKTLSLSETRLVSDEIQLKLLNSYFVPKEILTRLTVQQYAFDLYLPLNIQIDLLLERNYILTNSIDITSVIIKLRLSVANFLSEKNNISIKFYSSKLIDFIHNTNDWIKNVNITLKDSKNNTIESNNIETIDQQTYISTSTKEEILNFCPILWWFDINRLIINYTFYGD